MIMRVTLPLVMMVMLMWIIRALVPLLVEINSELNLFIALQIEQMDINIDHLTRMDLIEDEIES